MRLRLDETPAFQEAEERGRRAVARGGATPEEEERLEQARMSGKGRLKEVVTQHWQAMLVCIGLVLLYNVTNYMVTSYLPTYMSAPLGEPELTAQLLVLGTMVLVGTTPLVASALVNTTGNELVPAYYLMAAGAIGVVSALFLRETAGKPLRGSSAMVESEEEAREMVARSRTHAGRRARDIWLQLRRGHLPHLPHRSDKGGRQDRHD
ncbi:hypothetical protein ADK54_25700 [Streptomyces sp. WM6378]|nr:hypothetical protein ADK54_25700 [Streptomyces sp. WM6378]